MVDHPHSAIGARLRCAGIVLPVSESFTHPVVVAPFGMKRTDVSAVR